MDSAASGAVAVADPVEGGDVGDELAGGESGRHRLVLGHERQPGVHPAVGDAGRRRRTLTEPCFSEASPAIARIIVVLPAPLGPSSPVIPAPNEQLTSDRATFCPNHTDASRTSTVGSATNAGSSPTDAAEAATPCSSVPLRWRRELLAALAHRSNHR